MFNIGKKRKEPGTDLAVEPVIVSSDENLLSKSRGENDEAVGPSQPENWETPETSESGESESVGEPKTETPEVLEPQDAALEQQDNDLEPQAGGGSDDSDAMMAAFEAWLEDSMPDADSREAAKAAMSLVHDSLMAGDYDEAVFDVIAKGADYGRAVDQAARNGEIRGRNASIDELMSAKGADDGLPHPGANGGTAPRQRQYSIFDLARM